MEHTPTPWKVSITKSIIRTADESETHIAICHNENAANARRIVACVNACEGIETEWLEKSKLTFTASAINKIQDGRGIKKLLSQIQL